MVISSLVAGAVLAPVWLFVNKFQVQISLVALAYIFMAAIVYMLAAYLYFKALEHNDASIIIVMYQLIPVFSYILSWILFKETLAINQIIGGLILMLSAIIISFDFSKSEKKCKSIVLVMMLGASFFSSLYFIFFDYAMRNADYNMVVFWYQVALLFIGLIYLLIRPYREEFFSMISKNGKKFVTINLVNEVINAVANLMVNFANLLIPLALVNLLNGFQGAFVFIIGAIGIAVYPEVFSEELNKKVVIQKIFCILLGIVGFYIMFM